MNAVVARTGKRRRGTSLRTRSFLVIVLAVLIPALFLCSLSVWVYFRTWNHAGIVYTGQARDEVRGLWSEIALLDRKPQRFSAAERAALSRAIAAEYALHGQHFGPDVSTLQEIGAQQLFPAWAVRSLKGRGFAIGGLNGPTAPDQADVVAWRVGPRTVHYFHHWQSATLRTVNAPIRQGLPIGLLVGALVVALGLLGAWVLSRSVVRPVRRLAEASGRLAEGEGGVTVTPEGPRELQELATSFNDMNAKLTKAQEAEQSFLLSVSHELKTPLTSIRGYAEGLGDGALASDEAARVIGAESARLERLVGDLLDSARMRKSAFSVRRELVDLAEVAHDVGRRHDATAHSAGLGLNVDVGGAGIALADRDRVLQVVSNLVENAVRCTPAPGTVTIRASGNSISVADTGRGLTSDDLPRAFERFYLYSRYGVDRPVGTGLGLAIVKELTEAMGGTVSVSSAVGVGTAFVVTLPADGIAAGGADATAHLLGREPSGETEAAVRLGLPETAGPAAPAVHGDGEA